MAVIEQKLFIEGPLPGLNEIIACAKVSNGYRNGKKSWNAYADMKKKWGEIIRLTALVQGIKPVTRVWIDCAWIEPNRKRDPDNICAGRKFILDGLVHAGILQNDGWQNVAGLSDSFVVVGKGERPGVLVTITEDLREG